MSLYVRVQTGFYSHRKTMRLRVSLGSDAFWIPPRLWAYAAENQPDGIFSDYSPEELAMLIGYSGNACSMLEALLGAGFLDSDPLRIHDWSHYNAYHEAFANRARKAANARWEKIAEKKEPKKREEEKIREDKTRDKHCLTIAQAMLEASDEKPKSSEPTVPELVASIIEDIGFNLYNRPEGQRATQPEELAALAVIKRPNWQAEKDSIMVLGRICRPNDRRFWIPRSLHHLLENWSETLDKARTYNPNNPNERHQRPDRIGDANANVGKAKGKPVSGF